MHKEKHERFVRIAERRTNEAIRRLQILGNCANRSSYDYAPEEVNKMFSEIERALKESKAKFTFPNRDRFSF